MRVGLDLDNTIVSYDRVFPAIAKRIGLLQSDFKGDKKSVREALYQHPDGEQEWMTLQGQVYGRYISAADIFPGIEAFLTACKMQNCDLYIVSHKTQYGHFDAERHDLRAGALRWMEEHAFFDEHGFSIDRNHVFFADTLDQKIDIIQSLNLDLFIDDLEKVLDHPNFPQSTRAIQFSSVPPDASPQTAKPYVIYATWQDITRDVFSEISPQPPSPTDLAQRLCKNKNVRAEKALAGGNNNVWHIKGYADPVALKVYNTNLFDPRDRLGTEQQALTFLNRHGEPSTPVFHTSSSQHSAALISWIEGDVVLNPTHDDLSQAIAFVKRLITYSKLEDAQGLPIASEACLSELELRQQVDHRLTRLSQQMCLYPALETFVSEKLVPTFISLTTADASPTINAQERILSPSDFGFHNAIRKPDGDLVFIDFEYFGWDDPVKLAADFVLHPGMSLSHTQKQTFVENMCTLFQGTEAFAPRLKRHYPLYALRWCAIILNPFIPTLGAPAQFEDDEARQQLQAIRLVRAQQLFDTVFLNQKGFPYDI